MKHYSTQPRKQRLYGYNRNAHDRSRAMSAHLSDELLKEYSRMRSLTVRKGDTVKVVRGAFKGQVAKVIKVFPRKGMISIEEATLTKADNKKVARLFRPSKVILTKLDLSDPWRREKLQRGKVSPAEERKEERAAEKEAKEERAAEKQEKEERAQEKADREEKAADKAEKAAEKEEKAAVKELKADDKAEKAADKAEKAVEKKAEAPHPKPEHKEAPKAEHNDAAKPEHKEAPKAEHPQSRSKEASK
jgi:large subunit ribosomal protein L24